MNVLVTGGAGFIGSHVCERLVQAGHAVWAFDDLNGSYDVALKQQNLKELRALGEWFHFVHGEITERAALEELMGSVWCDQVIHLAARAGRCGPGAGKGVVQQAAHGHRRVLRPAARPRRSGTFGSPCAAK